MTGNNNAARDSQAEDQNGPESEKVRSSYVEGAIAILEGLAISSREMIYDRVARALASVEQNYEQSGGLRESLVFYRETLIKKILSLVAGNPQALEVMQAIVVMQWRQGADASMAVIEEALERLDAYPDIMAIHMAEMGAADTDDPAGGGSPPSEVHAGDVPGSRYAPSDQEKVSEACHPPPGTAVARKQDDAPGIAYSS